MQRKNCAAGSLCHSNCKIQVRPTGYQDVVAKVIASGWRKYINSIENPSGIFDERAGRNQNFSLAIKPEMRAHRAPVISSIIERYAILFWKQRVNLKRTGRLSNQSWPLVPLHLGSTSKVFALAALDGRLVGVEFQQCIKASPFAGINPVDDDTRICHLAVRIGRWHRIIVCASFRNNSKEPPSARIRSCMPANPRPNLVSGARPIPSSETSTTISRSRDSAATSMDFA